MPVDVDFLTDAFGSAQKAPVAAPPPPPPSTEPDADFLSQSFSKSPLPTQPEQALQFDPLGTFFRGLQATGNIAAAVPEDIAYGAADIYAGRTPTFENLRSAFSTYEPTPAERDLAQENGIGAGLTGGIVGAIKSAPTLAAGAAITAVTKLPPEVIYPALFGGETYERTGDVMQSAKAATIGLAYPVLGRAVKPLAAGLINRLGLVANPTAQKVVETTVDQGLMQAFTHVISLPEYAQMPPEDRARAIAENTGNLLAFALPRALGYARGTPSEYEAAIRQESGRLENYLATENVNAFLAARTPDEQTDAAIRAGLIRAGAAKTPEQRQADIENQRQAGQQEIERTFSQALGTTPARQSAAEAAAGQGIPVGTTEPAQPAAPEAPVVFKGVMAMPGVTPVVYYSPTTEIRGADGGIYRPGGSITAQNLSGFTIPAAELAKAEAEIQRQGGTDAIHPESQTILRPVQQPGGPAQGAGQVPTVVGGAQTGARSGGVADVAAGGEEKAAAPQAAQITGGAPEASIVVTEHSDGFKVSGLSVPPTQRGQGIGSAKMREVIDKSNAIGKPVFLTAVADSEALQPALNRFYERLGFKHYRDDPLSGKPMYRYDPSPEAQVIPPAKEGDIVELYGHVGELGRDADGRAIITTATGIVEIPEGGVAAVRLAVTPEGNIVRNGVLFEPSVGADKPWTNAYNRDNGWLRIRKVGDGIRLVLEGPSAKYVAAKLGILEPAKEPSKPVRAPKLPAEATEAGLAEGEPTTSDTPVDEFILKSGLDNEAKARAAAVETERRVKIANTVTLRNNIAQPLPELPLERYRRKGGEPHSGEIKPARVIYNPTGPNSAYLMILGQKEHYSYRIPLAALPEGSWKVVKGGLEFDKRAVLAFLNSDEQRFTNRNLSNRGEYFTPADIDRITGVTPKPGRPGLPGRRVSIDLPTGAKGETLEAALEVPSAGEEQSRRPITGIARRALDGLLARAPDLHGEMLDKPATELDEPFWARVKSEIAQDPEFNGLTGEGAADRAATVATDTLRAMKESGQLNAQASIQGRLSPVPTPGGHTERIRNALLYDLDAARQMVERPDTGMSDEGRAVLRDILNSPVAEYLNGRNIKLRLVDSLGAHIAGRYNPVLQLIELVRSGTNPMAGAHEFFHPLWEMIQDSDRALVKQWRDQAVFEALMKGMKEGPHNEKYLDAIERLARGELSSDEFVRADLPIELYPLRSAEEYFAYTMTERFQQDRQGIWGQAKEILASQDAFLSKVRQIIGVIMDAIRRNVPGLRTQADVLQRQILSGKYDVLPIEGGTKDHQRGGAMLDTTPELPPNYVLGLPSPGGGGGWNVFRADGPGETPMNIAYEHAGMLGMGMSKEEAVKFAWADYRRRTPKQEQIGQPREPQAMLESPEKVEEYVEPLERITTPERFRSMAAVLNKNMVPPPAAARFSALPAGVQGELAEVFPGRIATYAERPNAPSFRDVMRNEAIPPEERSDYARHAFDELRKYQADKMDVLGQLTTVDRDLEQATRKAIEIIPETNEAELLATTLVGNLLDRIKTERERTAEGAQANALIGSGIAHIEEFNDLLSRPVPLANAMRGIATLVGRAALTAARPGGDILELIGQRSGFDGGVFVAGTNEWIHALAAHLSRLETPAGNRRAINASEEIIESTLHVLYRLGDAREALHEFQLADDGTLRRFRADYLADLQSKTPRGFNTILRKYASAQVEADALTSASKRLDRKIDALTTRKANLEGARDFLAEHDRDPAFMDYGKAVVQYTGADQAEFTRDGTKVIYTNPMTGKLVPIEETFKEGGSVENIQKLRDLAQDGLTYAAQPGADPLRAAFWVDFAENIDNYMLAGSPYYDVLTDPRWNVMTMIGNMAQFMIAETQLARIPGFGSARSIRALRALSPAMKVKNAYQKDTENILIASNIDAWKSHPDISSLQQWQDEVAMPIHDRRQHYGQNVYNVRDTISGYGHVITPEDMKAVKNQAHYDHVLVGLNQRAMSAAVAEAPQKIKIGENVRRFALMRGPGTVTRLIPQSTRDLPAQWFEMLRRKPEERIEGEADADAGAAAAAARLNTFLGTGRNFFKIVMGHVLEGERDYGQLGKGPLAEDYRAMREDEKEMADARTLPNNMEDLSDWLAAHHNEHLAENEEPITASDARQQLILDISDYMRAQQENNKESANRAKVDITSYENSFTQPREVKVVPGTLYEYGIADRFKANRMGNDAIEYYIVRWRDALQTLYDDLLRQRGNIKDTLRELYGGESRKSSKQLRKAIQAGEHEDRLGRYQLTAEEVDKNINRVGSMLQNSKDLLKRRDEFYGDDIANRLFSPSTSFVVGNLLLSPSTWILNGSSGSIMGALKVAQLNRGGWLTAPFSVVKAHLRTVYKTLLSKPPKNEQEAIIQRLASDHTLQDGVIELLNDTNQDFQDRQILRRSGVVDSFSYHDNLGLDRDLPLARNIRNAIETIRSVSAKPDPNLAKEVISYLGVVPKTWTILTRAIGMRWADNWINLQSTTLGNGIAERLRLRSMKSFDNRLENDPRFAELFRQYGDSFQRFSIALAGEGSGGFLTPSEITGRLGPTARKAAVQLRRTFFGNNDPVDKVMLRYWWNQRSTNGDRNAPFMTQAQRSALQFSIAEDINMGTLASRAQYFQGSRLRQMLGVLGQYWIWNTDKLSEIFAGVRGQKGYGRYLPGAMAFLIGAGLVGLVSGQLSQQVTEKLYNAVSNKPAFWEATDDPQKLKIILSNMANYLGMVGSAAKYFMDTPGKLGYRNPILLQNIVTDLMDTIAKVYQSGDALNPTLDFLARYMPPLRIALNRADMRVGLMDIRNAANALRAATPDSMEAKRRQPTAGSDLRLTPMTPLYNAILNSAAVGDWASADESFAKAVEQARADGNPNPEQSIISAIHTRAPESSAYSRTLTDEERDMVYSRLSPENRAAVDKANQVFMDIASRYGTGGGGGGGAGGIGGGTRQAGLAPRFGAAAGFAAGARLGAGIGLSAGLGGAGRLSLGAPRGVRLGLRSRSLSRGLRTRGLLRGIGARRPRVGGRLRRLAV